MKYFYFLQFYQSRVLLLMIILVDIPQQLANLSLQFNWVLYKKNLNFFVNLAISYILIQLLMSTRVRNPEVYVKGYGKNTTKDDLKQWFKEYGKIVCIQYKGPYSFIEFEDYYDAESAVKEMNDKKVEGYRLIVEPSGKKRYGNNNRSRSRSRDRKSKHRRRSPSSSSSSSSSRSSGSSSSDSGSSSSAPKVKESEVKKKSKTEQEK